MLRVCSCVLLLALLPIHAAEAYVIDTCGGPAVDTGPQNEAQEFSGGFCDDRANANVLPDGIELVIGSVRGPEFFPPFRPADEDWFVIPDAAPGAAFTVGVLVGNNDGVQITIYDQNRFPRASGTATNEGLFVEFTGVTGATDGALTFEVIAAGDSVIPYYVQIDVARVPEPSTGLLLATGMLALAGARRRRR